MSKITDEEFNSICYQIEVEAIKFMFDQVDEKLPANQAKAMLHILTRMITKSIYLVSKEKSDQELLIKMISGKIRDYLDNMKQETIQ